MNYTKETRINTIPNAKNILEDTIKIVQNIYDNYTIGDFINTEKETGEESFASTTFGIFGGCGTGAGANVPKKFKGSLTEKIGQALATWRKNEKGLDKVANAVKNEKITMAKNMLLAKLSVDQIAKITGLSVDEISALNA
jgi:hypothetical protein